MDPTAIDNLTPQTVVPFIEAIFKEYGNNMYLGEPVTISEHMLQCAALAEKGEQQDDVIVAALLHDIGHFTSTEGTFAMNDDIDRRHEDAGALLLERFFPPLVTECVRHHVAAKRYLCATRPEYHDRLSEASVASLKLQGGPMSDEEVKEFEQNPYLDAIVQIRYLDDTGKDDETAAPSLEHFLPRVRKVVSEHTGVSV